MRTLLMTISLISLAACGTSRNDEANPDLTTSTTVAADTSSDRADVSATQSPPSTMATTAANEIEGTIVRFTSGDVQVDVTITQDNPTTRDFLSLLPLTIVFEEFNGREKIGYLPRELVTEGYPGHDSEDGDLIYFAPWGNLGFYYNAEGIGHDDRVILLGTYNATPEQLAGLEAGDVTIAIVE
jgi:hypothetical protein